MVAGIATGRMDLRRLESAIAISECRGDPAGDATESCPGLNEDFVLLLVRAEIREDIASGWTCGARRKTLVTPISFAQPNLHAPDEIIGVRQIRNAVSIEVRGIGENLFGLESAVSVSEKCARATSTAQRAIEGESDYREVRFVVSIQVCSRHHNVPRIHGHRLSWRLKRSVAVPEQNANATSPAPWQLDVRWDTHDDVELAVAIEVRRCKRTAAGAPGVEVSCGLKRAIAVAEQDADVVAA